MKDQYDKKKIYQNKVKDDEQARARAGTISVSEVWPLRRAEWSVGRLWTQE